VIAFESIKTLDVKHTAYALWKQLNIAPPVDVRKLAHIEGVEYCEEPFVRQVAGLFTMIHGKIPVIAVNASFSPDVRRLIACHEFGHYLFHRQIENTEPVIRFDTLTERVETVEEQLCDRFAIEMSLPEHLVSGGVLACKHMEYEAMIRQMCKWWEVPKILMRQRLRELGFTSG
jgi:Zn-dependent peptidase ImmA (M78 family)